MLKFIDFRLEFSFTSTRVRDCVFRSARLRVIEHNVEFLKEYPHIVTVFKNDDGLHEHKLEWEFVGGQMAGKSHQEGREENRMSSVREMVRKQ